MEVMLNLSYSTPVDDELTLHLQRSFGLPSFRPYQEKIIKRLLQGKNALIIMPTGSGKSLCYQLPSLLKEGVGIIIGPLIALMEDQVLSLQKKGLRAEFLHSGLSREKIKEIEYNLLYHPEKIDLLYLAPERFTSPHFFHLLQKIKIALFAIDEAHCISQWGHDFRPEYRALKIIPQVFPQVPRIALTATADQTTKNDIEKELGFTADDLFQTGPYRPNLFYQVESTAKKSSHSSQMVSTFHRIENYLHQDFNLQTGIIYCSSKKNAESLFQFLSKKGFLVLLYHGGLSDQERSMHLKKFLTEPGVIMVATIAFGMGIHHPHIRFVIHLNLPKNLEAYYQETGRAGRDGEKAKCLLFFNLKDVFIQRYFIHQSQSQSQSQSQTTLEAKKESHEESKLQALINFCQTRSCRTNFLLRYFAEEVPPSFEQEGCQHCDNCCRKKKHFSPQVAAPLKTWPKRKNAASDTEEAQQLWKKLKSYRLKVAKEHHLRPKDILPDSALMEMVVFRPRGADELKKITSATATKLSQYGPLFIQHMEYLLNEGTKL